MRKLLLVITGFYCLLNICFAQDSVPKLTGNIKISIKEGSIESDLKLENIPHLEDYYIRLNKGMNVLNWKSLDGKGFLLHASVEYDKDSFQTGESMAYYFLDNTRKRKYLPNNLEVKYVGKFPVVKDTLNDNYMLSDWKGNIAFNSYSLRTDGAQSSWYPILYDIKKDLPYDNITYDINVSCIDCKVLYVNGSAPLNSNKGQFESKNPVPINLYCGDFKYKEIDSIYFLNPDLNKNQLDSLGRDIDKYKKYYQQTFAIPYKDAFTLIHTTPLSKRNAWSFASFPSVVNIGFGKYGLQLYLDSANRLTIAHELAHYYFGNYRKFNDVLGDMMLEGFTEYTGMQLMRNLISPNIYNKILTQKINILKDFQAVPFGKIKVSSDFQNRELYVYYYAPVIFTAIEKIIGTDNMNSWLKNILNNKEKTTNYAFLSGTLKNVIGEQKFAEIESQLLTSDISKSNAIELISK
ncbi:gluzincin family metallopeptidase [Rhizosphaericola mali]|uniref:M1 family metallopeptidase n=1 Tax=Rhizosphaericola mali TaxID=2545455 RepID=A0A5P2GB22_9BACT|nr:hypothetical protein [Rhizosphaericola mali]QES90403.1 hypothetical protein E0W69_017670 [Rhizosphaericola mali]